VPLPCKKVLFEGHVFHVAENVYEPAEDSFLFVENMNVGHGERIVDVGTGCGILGIVAAAEADKVIAVDINPHAVRCAKANAKLNRVADKMSFIRGDLFTPMRTRKQFDLILFNAPYLPSEDDEADSWLERAWVGGASGRDVIDTFIAEAPKYLKLDGKILLMQSTLSGIEETLRDFRERGLKADVVAKQDLPFFETVVLVTAEFK
jgi:release factor glutamine methyltransferase